MCDEAFSSVDLVHQCLIDEKRTNAFGRAIEKIVNKGDIVLDAGTGSGIMALFAARAGAKKVIAIELDEKVAKMARSVIKNNGYEKIIDVRIGDARNFKYGKIKFDVVIMEMLTTGMIDEYQIEAVNNIHNQKLVKKSTKFIPNEHQTYIALADTKFNMYGFEMKMVKHYYEKGVGARRGIEY